MNKVLKFILLIIISPFEAVFELLRDTFLSVKRLFCRHEWEYRDVKLKCDHHDSINNTIFRNQWKYCNKCKRGYQAVRTPGNWGTWDRNYGVRELFDKYPSGAPIEQWVNIFGQKNDIDKVKEERQKKIDSILNNKENKLDNLLDKNTK